MFRNCVQRRILSKLTSKYSKTGGVFNSFTLIGVTITEHLSLKFRSVMICGSKTGGVELGGIGVAF